MGISAINLTATAGNFAASSYNTAGFTTAQHNLVICSIASNVASAVVPTISGLSLAWDMIGTTADATGARRVTMFRNLSAAPQFGALTIDFAGQSQNNCAWSIDQFSGVDRSGVNGSRAIVQFNGTTQNTTGSAFFTPLIGLSSVNNAVYGFVRNSTAAVITAGVGFIELSQNSAIETEAQWRFHQANVNWTWASQTVVSVGMSIEIKAEQSGILGMP